MIILLMINGSLREEFSNLVSLVSSNEGPNGSRITVRSWQFNKQLLTDPGSYCILVSRQIWARAPTAILAAGCRRIWTFLSSAILSSALKGCSLRRDSGLRPDEDWHFVFGNAPMAKAVLQFEI